MISDEAIAKAARQAVIKCLGVQPGERVLVVCDPGTARIAEALHAAAKVAEADSVLMRMEARKTHGDEPPLHVSDAMHASDVVFCATTKSISHTAARRQACAAGSRIASLPGITDEVFARGLSVDYDEISERSIAVAERLTGASTVRITTEAGTDLTFSIEGRDGDPDTGLYLDKGEFGNLPAGEGSCGPLEGTAAGRLIIDGSMAGIGMLVSPIEMIIVDGLAGEISGGIEADALRAMLNAHGDPAHNIAELGVGTNHAAMLTGNVLEDEKILGTIHIALGNNMSYGGHVDVPLHLDGVILKPTVYLDGALLLENGNLVLNEAVRVSQ